MPEVKWIKVTTDIFDDEKILLIESLPDSYAIITVWFKLLCLAGKQNNSGVFMMGRIPYTDNMLATIFRMRESTVTMALQTFEQFGMVEIIDGVITIPNWNKHQTLDAYEKKKERDRLYQAERRASQKALIEKSSDSNTTQSSYVAISDKEDKEKDKDKDKDKDKEFHSIIHSNAREEEAGAEPVENHDDREELRMKYWGGKLGGGVVFISQEQFDDLLEKLSFDEFNKYFEIVRDCELAGKHFKNKTHYQAILDMAMKDRKTKGGKVNA
jgi:predicted phage replisome organizer